jgi:adenylate cyclase
LLWGMLLGVVCRLSPTVIAAAIAVGLDVLYGIVVLDRFTTTGSWYPLIVPVFFQTPLAFFGAVLWKYFDTHKERQNIRKAFGYYLPEKVVEQLSRNVAEVKTNSQLVYGICLYTDADQYTALAETMHPKDLGSLMNQYYEAVFEPVRQYGGIVSDVVGDAMLALWATAQPDAALRKQACLAALDISSAVQRFIQSASSWQIPTRIGLHSGAMLLGNVGALDHYEYRAVGDIVNTSSRIEGLNKQLGTRILVSEEVLDQLAGLLT